MRKSFNTYLVIWIIAIVLFNLTIFVIPSSIDGKTIINVVNVVSKIKGGVNNLDASLLQLADILLNSADKEMILYKYGGAFWPSYVCIMFAFIGQLICSIFAFTEKNNQKFFYKLPLITISYTGLVFVLIFGVVGMFFPNFPIWLAVVICLITFVITLVAVLKASLAADIISKKDDEIIQKTSTMKKLINKAESLYKSETDKNKKDELKKVYEALRYSDPVSNEHTVEIEKEIEVNLSNAEKALVLINNRNAICKNNK